MRDFAKYLIAAAIIGGEGGSMLIAGLEFGWMSGMFSSMMSGYSIPGGGMFAYFTIVFLCIGIPSAIVAGILLIIGLSKYSKQKNESALKGTPVQHSYQPSPPAPGRVEPVYQPSPLASRQVPNNMQPMENATINLNFCPECGGTLPEATNLHYCPDCGRRL